MKPQTTQEQLQKDCENIAKELNRLCGLKSKNKLNEYISGDNVLDFDYTITRNGEYKAVELCVAYGGPNIFIDASDGYIKGYWGGEEAQYPFSYDIRDALDDYFSELFQTCEIKRGWKK